MPKRRSARRGLSAKRKGSKAEIKLRNLLRSIYPPELRERVYRVPLSGAGAIKCDVMDLNDPDSAYEVKCQETLVLKDWWEQAVSQAGTSRTPVLVITQNYRPFYFIMRTKDWEAIRDYSGFDSMVSEAQVTSRNLMDKLADLDKYQVGKMNLADTDVTLVPQGYYLEVKEWQYKTKNGIIKT